MTATGKRTRLFRRAEDLLEADDSADLSEDEHAWWAARDGVAGVPRGASPDEDEPDEGSQFSDYWTAESLFEEPPPSSEPASDAGDDDELAGEMDLDAAHLVLGVPIGAEWEAVTKAHRRLAKQYHPDLLVEYSAEAQDLGRSRMAEINAAHATLRTLHFH